MLNDKGYVTGNVSILFQYKDRYSFLQVLSYILKSQLIKCASGFKSWSLMR